MLVLDRKVDQRIFVGPSIELVVVSIDGDRVKIGIEAPPDVLIVRDDAKKKE
jgi:carbon storage regulator